MIEENLAIICACLPVCRLPLAYLFPTHFSLPVTAKRSRDSGHFEGVSYGGGGGGVNAIAALSVAAQCRRHSAPHPSRPPLSFDDDELSPLEKGTVGVSLAGRPDSDGSAGWLAPPRAAVLAVRAAHRESV